MLAYSGRSRSALNLLKTIYFDHPEWTPCRVGIMPATWMKYREALEEVVLVHPRLFPGYRKGMKDFDEVNNPLYMPGEHVDCWGCVWRNVEKGLDAYVVKHPLADWDAFESWRPPDPLRDDLFGPQPDLHGLVQLAEEAKAAGDVATANPLPHGFLYLRLCYLRGFENFMMDLATDDPRISRLISIVSDYSATVVQKYVEAGFEYFKFGDDLGLQRSLPMSPQMWRRYMKPAFAQVFRPCRERDLPVYLHTDGHVLEIIPDLIETGVTVLNPQISANDLDSLREIAVGKVALDVDLNRQMFPFATPGQIREHIGAVYEALWRPEGGLMLYAECEPDVPLENIDAICSALEEVCNPPDPDDL